MEDGEIGAWGLLPLMKINRRKYRRKESWQLVMYFTLNYEDLIIFHINEIQC